MRVDPSQLLMDDFLQLTRLMKAGAEVDPIRAIADRLGAASRSDPQDEELEAIACVAREAVAFIETRTPEAKERFAAAWQFAEIVCISHRPTD
jgi:hypothetical protein